MAKKKQIRISQSLIKSLLDYKDGNECGLLFEAKYIDGKWDLFQPSDVQRVGTWFEYQLTGAIPKDGKIPEPVRTQKGELTAAYKKMQSHVDNFKKAMAYYGFKIKSVGDTLKWENLEGTIDILATATKDIYQDGVLVVKKGEDFIIDIKSTGLLDDKWNDYGWEINNLHNKHKLVTQPIHYKFIAKQLYGKDVPFLFILFSTSKENDFRIINFIVDEETLTGHGNIVKNVEGYLNKVIQSGFKAHPSVVRCSECPLRKGCKFFAAVPPITNYYYGHDMNT